jgi:hypothetical protein
MTATANEPKPNELIPELPPEETFWKKYNDRLEFPTSIVGSVFVFVFTLFLIIVVVYQLDKLGKKPIIPILPVDGFDESGVGSAGSGGVPEPIARGMSAPKPEDFAKLKLPDTLPKVKQDIQDRLKIDSPDTDIKVPDAEAAALATLDAALRDKMLGIGQQKGDGSSTGSGATGQVGSGPGGFGTDSTRARSMRWVLRFTFQDGRDYLRQLSLLKATILIPIPPTNNDMMIFKDLSTGAPNRPATAAEIDDLSRQMRFCEITSKSVQEIGQAFRLNFTPQSYFAFFPKDLEARLARDEENYRGRKAKDIEETIFKVTVNGNNFDIRIEDQTPKKK